jgi:nitrate/TMAO reductase-like tetraheme cytochrome c subunit
MTKRSLARNIISEAGLVIAFIAITNTAFLIYVDGTQRHSNPYMGILAWIIAPAIFCTGLAVFVAGMLLERRRRRKLAPDAMPEYPTLDLNVGRTRVIVAATTIAIIFFVTVSVVGSYQAYQFTDSDAFCGTLCHEVMKPEYTAYKLSPHARVGCVGCHVGPGATWYVRSKLSGAYQLYAVVANKVPRPIQSPVANLRPAQETCEQCHWPEKFWGAQMKTFQHYGYDETNTPHLVRMLIKVGGGSPTGGVTAGIHWHMNIANKVTYIATDPKRQTIPWVRIEDRYGHVTEYKAEDSKMTEAQIASADKRRMDCVDCHNRPTHVYVPPDRAVDAAIDAGAIDRTLPYVKQQAVAALVKDYATTPAALTGIAKDIPDYYSKTYAALYTSKRPAIDQTVKAVQQIFQNTRFPEMKVDWRTHPNNVGHYLSAGCFRCHDDQHVSKDGKKISKDCTICHEMITDTRTAAEFQHPVDLGDMRSVNCADCHTGGGM